jgi:hypothetical protein
MDTLHRDEGIRMGLHNTIIITRTHTVYFNKRDIILLYIMLKRLILNTFKEYCIRTLYNDFLQDNKQIFLYTVYLYNLIDKEYIFVKNSRINS